VSGEGLKPGKKERGQLGARVKERAVEGNGGSGKGGQTTGAQSRKMLAERKSWQQLSPFMKRAKRQHLMTAGPQKTSREERMGKKRTSIGKNRKQVARTSRKKTVFEDKDEGTVEKGSFFLGHKTQFLQKDRKRNQYWNQTPQK